MKLISRLLQHSRSSFKAGDIVKETRIVTRLELDKFSNLSGDHNPIHKSSSENSKPLVHGAFLNSIVAGIIGTKMPGPGTIVISQNFTFPSKCYAEDPIEITVELLDARKIMRVKYECAQKSNVVFQGEAKLMMIKEP
jgi:acyl dehydratase